MEQHHLIKNDRVANCLYCNENISKLIWGSQFEASLHYKIIKCKCGKNNIVKVDFCGSGHDNWKAGEINLDFEELIAIENKKLMKQ